MRVPEKHSVCAIDRVSLSLFQNGHIGEVATGHVLVYTDDQEISLRFIDYYGEERATIMLTPRSVAWLQPDSLLVFDRPEGGRWRLDCSASDKDSFTALQDILTYFIKYENRHQLKNALAMMNPVTCKVTEVIARNVQLEEEDVLSEKSPVMMEAPMVAGGSFKVRLLYQTSDAMVTGSDWIAQSFVLAGQSLARSIQIKTKEMSDTIEPAEKTIRLNHVDRHYVETFLNVNRTLFKGAGNLINKATTAATSSLNSLYTNDQLQKDPATNATRHFGVSLFHAAHNVVAGLSTATGAVLASSRDGVVDMVYKKYGQDAGYLAEKALGSSADDVADVLVYFDANGVARQVFVGASPFRTVSTAPSEASEHDRRDSLNRSVIFESDDFAPDGVASSSAPIHPLDLDELHQPKKEHGTFIHV